FSYEMWVLPKGHSCRFEASTDSELAELANLLQPLLGALESQLRPVAYNLLIHSAPFDSFGHEHYHWHIEILPRQSMVAGFEWGSGCYINPVSPEDAARFLCDARRK